MTSWSDTKQKLRTFIHWCKLSSEWCRYGSFSKGYIGFNAGRIHGEIAWN